MNDTTRKNAEANADISDMEIERDIADTESEITIMTAEAEHFEKTPLSLPSARMYHMRASARRTGIKQRQEFIKKLKSILAYRKQNHAN